MTAAQRWWSWSLRPLREVVGRVYTMVLAKLINSGQNYRSALSQGFAAVRVVAILGKIELFWALYSGQVEIAWAGSDWVMLRKTQPPSRELPILTRVTEPPPAAALVHSTTPADRASCVSRSPH